MQIDWLHILDEYWCEKDTPYSDGFDLCLDWMFQYCNELTLGKSFESAYIA